MLLNFLCVGLGGAIGAMGRYGIFLLGTQWLGFAAPLATFLANIVGCFVIGILLGYGLHKQVDSTYLLLAVGLLGAFTTFSTFSAETLLLALEGQLWMSFLNIICNVAGCLFSCYFGLYLAAYWSGSDSLIG